MAKRFFYIISPILEYLLMFLLLVMVAINFADVLGRHLFNRPIFGIHDLTEHLMALIVFCGLPLVTIGGLHIAVDILDVFLKKPYMRWWRHIIVLVMAVILFLVAWTFLQSSLEAAEIKDVSGELRIARGPLYLFISVSSLLSAVGLLYQEYIADETLIEISEEGAEL